MTEHFELPGNFMAALRSARLHKMETDLSQSLAHDLKMNEATLRHGLAARFSFGLIEDYSVGEEHVRFDRISVGECRERTLLDLSGDTGKNAVVIDDPWDTDLQQWLAGRFGQFPVLIWASGTKIRALIDRAVSGPTRANETGETSGEARPGNQPRTISLDSVTSHESPVIRFVDSILLDAWKAGASDIHFETGRERLEVRFRLDGVLVPSGKFGEERPVEEVINRIKVLAQLDVSETRVPQDGRFRAKLGDRELDFRVSIMPSIFGEDAVVRLLDKAQLRTADSRIDLERLGFERDVLASMRALALRPHGMLLVTGPTGSGKTTSLYAVLSEIYSTSEKLITIEDPVEYELPGVLQIPVNEKKGLTFARGLRSILRHDPDRILVGEIRDHETAEIAIQAALTGHLVFTTVHANNVFDVVGRFTHMGIDLYNFMAALNGVVAQRLLRVNCLHCVQNLSDHAVEERVARYLATHYPHQQPDKQPIQLRRGMGCEACRGTGYKGRTAIAEILPITHTLRDLVIRRESGQRLREYATAEGVVTLAARAHMLVARGTTTMEEVDRVIDASD